jgi:ATP phosphoribosyltransferase regulatory subunit HisZ
MNHETDTPRTDELLMQCPSHLQEVALANLAQDLERELANSLANQLKSQAEVERMKKTSRSRDRALEFALNEVTRLEQRVERLNESFELALSWVPTPNKLAIMAALNPTDK